jgi:hypothetical protein
MTVQYSCYLDRDWGPFDGDLSLNTALQQLTAGPSMGRLRCCLSLGSAPEREITTQRLLAVLSVTQTRSEDAA